MAVVLRPLFAIFFIASFIFTANTVQLATVHVPFLYAPRTKSNCYCSMTVFAGFILSVSEPLPSQLILKGFSWVSLAVHVFGTNQPFAPIDYILENSELDKRRSESHWMSSGLSFSSVARL